ncbi:MAG: amidohydrolase [Gammaproteobacteria bacterium]|nr:amidohydrolase [Gammaproteobacteria bacterium]MDH3374250.1 amidohydrolase [Gammaproteobacteria bacterium]MDH3409997.1 amidohydrolase [Gammaproteobacteria bacterium]MDH3551899.1 amidohydrolase [Gammaproteobacteria bacterium]
MTPVIDIHSHFLPEQWPDLAERFGTPDWPWMRHTEVGKAMLMVGDKEFRPVYDACWSASRRLEEMDRDGIDLQVISATPILFAYSRPIDHAADCAQLFNDLALDICGQGQGRLLSLCQVPLQDTDAACKTLSRAMQEGHVGVQIGNHVEQRNLDDEGLITFLQHCADEGAAVLVHPWDMLAPERTAKYMMAWTVGMPAETQLGIVSMILGGAFDKLPENLRLCFAHGGGSFAFLLGRLDNAWRRRDIVRGQSKNLPSSYARRFYVDSAVFDPTALRFLADVMGEDRVMLGSDYPFPLGEEFVGELIRNAAGFDDAAKARLLGGNALEFLNIPAAQNASA